jgi:DTW domain-containing protein YfiP
VLVVVWIYIGVAKGDLPGLNKVPSNSVPFDSSHLNAYHLRTSMASPRIKTDEATMYVLESKNPGRRSGETAATAIPRMMMSDD